MRVLILDGLDRHTTSPLQAPLLEALAGTQLDHVRLAETAIAWCRGCFQCWLITPGECVIGDAGNEVARKLVNSDLAILLSPVTFGSYSPDLKKALDRLIPNLSGLFTRHQGETHHLRRYPYYPALAVLGLQQVEDHEAAAVFKDLAGRNRLNFYPRAFAAGVFCEAWSAGRLRAELGRVLLQVGVTL